MAATKEDISRLEQSLNQLLELNTTLSNRVNALQEENDTMKKAALTVQKRMTENKEKWSKCDQEIVALVEELSQLKEALEDDNVEDSFFQENCECLNAVRNLFNGVLDTETGPPIQVEIVEEVVATPFAGTAREERLELQFGLDNDYSAVALRRFIERFRVVKQINMQGKITGWDSPVFRASKLKLGLVNDPFDYISFESSMSQSWTNDDQEIIEKLKDKYMNVQAVELNILTFENASQEPKEDLAEYLMRLRRQVKEAYDGEDQPELDKRVAWKFVSGVQDKRITKKLMEKGWMLDRRFAKPLEELLKLAEVTKQTEDAVKILDKEKNGGSINMFQDCDVGHIAAVDKQGYEKRNNRSKTSSGDSARSSGSSQLPLDVVKCWYCQKEHRGGWFYCSKRKREDPKWKPPRYSPKSKPTTSISSQNEEQGFRM